MTPEERQHVIDTEHLRLLALFHYISGGLTLAFSCLFIFQLMFMLFIAVGMGPFTDKHGAPAEPFPAVFIAVIFGMFICLGIALGVMEILSGRSIGRRRARLMSMIVAAPGVLMFPFGTVLSVMTWIVLARPSVQAMYAEPDQ